MQPDDFLDVLATTRAIRRYRPEPIPDEDLNKILYTATRAPSGSNRQPLRYLVLRDGEGARAAKSLLGVSFRRGWAEKTVSDGYNSGSGTASNTPKARFAQSMQDYVDNFEQIPVVILLCYRPRHHSVADGGSIFPAAQNLLLAARALGYGGVITGWHRAVEGELAELLGIPEGIDIAATLTLGKPQGNHGPVRRRPLAEVVYEDHWDSSPTWATDPADARFTQAGPPTDT